MTTARKYVLESLFQGNPKPSDLKIVEETLPAIKDGGELSKLNSTTLLQYNWIPDWCRLAACIVDVPANGKPAEGVLSIWCRPSSPEAFIATKHGWATAWAIDGLNSCKQSSGLV